MTINEAGLSLIKAFEGCKLAVYKDPVGIPTVGYGHVDSMLKVGDTITDDEATTFLRQDLSTAESGLSKALDRLGLMVTDNQFSALVSLAYNIGVGRVVSSHILTSLENDDLDGAADGFLQFVFAKGVKLPGLVRRRSAERGLFLA